MKILILSDDFYPESKGGADKVALDLALKFFEKGHQVFVITSTQNKENQELGINFKGIEIYRIYVPYYHERWKAYLSLYNPKAIRKVKEVIKEIQPDITHVHNIHYYLSYYSLKIAKKHSKAVFLTAHDVMSFHYGKLFEFISQINLNIPKEINYKISFWQQIKRFKKRYNPFRNIIIKHYLKYVDKIIAVSNALKMALNQNGIKNVEVIHNGIDIENWRVDQEKIKRFKNKFNLNNKKVVLFGGRLSALKGGNKIIEAMDSVFKEVPEAVLLVLGKKDSYAQKMKKLAEEKGIKLVFTDWLQGTELKAAYWSSDLVITPSICLDTFNLVNLEAMACHKPVIGICFGGAPEVIIDQQTGYLINPFDINDMVNKIIVLLKDFIKVEKFGERGYQRAKQKFNLNQQTDKYLLNFKKYV